jgi:O-methyltransferase
MHANVTMKFDILKQPSSKLRYSLDLVRFLAVYRKFKKFTMINRRAYVENLALMDIALANAALTEGAVIECGTWKGGMAGGMIMVGGTKRRYYFFDSFAGLPPAQDIDGETAKRWQADTTSPRYHNNCTATLEEFEAAMTLAACPPQLVEVRKGFFEDVFPAFSPPPVAILRLDGDWYESTITCLEKFWPAMIPGGLIILDDYYTWDGCSRAVHDFLSKHRASERVRQGPIGRVAYIIKE